MLNLRQLNKSDIIPIDSDAQHFSRFSMECRVPSGLLGNIGEALDYGQSEQLHGVEPSNDVVADEQLRDAVDLESAEPTTGLPETRWNDAEQATLRSIGLSGHRGEELFDASSASDEDIVDF